MCDRTGQVAAELLRFYALHGDFDAAYRNRVEGALKAFGRGDYIVAGDDLRDAAGYLVSWDDDPDTLRLAAKLHSLAVELDLLEKETVR